MASIATELALGKKLEDMNLKKTGILLFWCQRISLPIQHVSGS